MIIECTVDGRVREERICIIHCAKLGSFCTYPVSSLSISTRAPFSLFLFLSLRLIIGGRIAKGKCAIVVAYRGVDGWHTYIYISPCTPFKLVQLIKIRNAIRVSCRSAQKLLPKSSAWRRYIAPTIFTTPCFTTIERGSAHVCP